MTKEKRTEVAIIGVGRVGNALIQTMKESPYRVAKLVFRTSDAAARFPALEDVSKSWIGEPGAIDGDLVFICTPDDAISEVASALAPHLRNPSAVIFHMSGALGVSALSSLADAGFGVGSVHPLVSVSEPRGTVFRNAYFAVEGVAEIRALGFRLVESLGGIPFAIDEASKALYHAAAVMACGHYVALFSIAVEMLGKCGIDAETARNALMPLVESTVTSLKSKGAAGALTGPFARGDAATFARHLAAFESNIDENSVEIYLDLAERSVALAETAGRNVEKLEFLRNKISLAKRNLR